MATLYFSGENSGAWGDVNSWYLTFNNTTGQLSNRANRIPNATDTAILCADVNDIATNNFVEPAVMQLGILYNNGANYYNSTWNGDNFYFYDRNFNFPVVNLQYYGHIWASTNYSYYFNIINFYYGSSIDGNASVGTANFYDSSKNGSDIDSILTGNVNFYNYSHNGSFDGRGTIYGAVNFYDYSTNAVGGNVGGTINGTAIFHNHSSNAEANADGSQGGIIYGNATFNDYSTNCQADNPDGSGAGGFVYGNATFNNNASNGSVDTTGGGYTLAFGKVFSALTYTSTSSFATTLQAGAGAATITMPATGISQSKVYLNELLQIPFPVVIQ